MNRTDQMILKFREVLKETERLGQDDLRGYQENLLVPLLEHSRKHVPFYRERLDAVFAGDEIDFTKWSSAPDHFMSALPPKADISGVGA